ncbi:hypothetical protein JA1_001935 [Spathaspora sp. JA1]|nr:hypothetical protein JA1_001935 [Spathaspora sp. JA1]
MDNKTYDDLSAISTLVQTLTPEVSETNDEILRLEKLIKELVTEEEYKELTKRTSSPPTGTITEDEIIKKLQEHRVNLVMKLQKQDFINEKLQELIIQNQDILDSVKEYLETKELIHQQELNHQRDLFNNFSGNVVAPTINSLDRDLQDMELEINRAQFKLEKLIDKQGKVDDVLQSSEYQEKLNLLVKSLNERE